MSKVRGEESIETTKNAALQVVEKEVASSPQREYRTWAFQVALFSAIGAFAVLTIMVKTTPFFPLDLRITKALQSIDSLLFASAMNLISWPGFLPQSVMIPAFVALLIYSFGLRWEAITALVAAFLPALINVAIKEKNGLGARDQPLIW